MNHTLGRHRRLYGLFHDTGTDKYRHELVWSFSSGRTDNSAELSDLEADELIRHLELLVKPSSGQSHPTRSGVDYRGQHMRRRILSLCYTIGWTLLDPGTGKHQVDYDRLERWMMKYGFLHKPLNDYSYAELQRLVVQFENLTQAVLTP